MPRLCSWPVAELELEPGKSGSNLREVWQSWCQDWLALVARQGERPKLKAGATWPREGTRPSEEIKLKSEQRQDTLSGGGRTA